MADRTRPGRNRLFPENRVRNGDVRLYGFRRDDDVAVSDVCDRDTVRSHQSVHLPIVRERNRRGYAGVRRVVPRDRFAAHDHEGCRRVVVRDRVAARRRLHDDVTLLVADLLLSRDDYLGVERLPLERFVERRLDL